MILSTLEFILISLVIGKSKYLFLNLQISICYICIESAYIYPTGASKSAFPGLTSWCQCSKSTTYIFYYQFSFLKQPTLWPFETPLLSHFRSSFDYYVLLFHPLDIFSLYPFFSLCSDIHFLSCKLSSCKYFNMLPSCGCHIFMMEIIQWFS